MSLRELTPQEAEAVTKELQAVLAKYDCEMGTTATITIMKRQEDAVLSPMQTDDIKADDNPESAPA